MRTRLKRPKDQGARDQKVQKITRKYKTTLEMMSSYCESYIASHHVSIDDSKSCRTSCTSVGNKCCYAMPVVGDLFNAPTLTELHFMKRYPVECSTIFPSSANCWTWCWPSGGSAQVTGNPGAPGTLRPKASLANKDVDL